MNKKYTCEHVYQWARLRKEGLTLAQIQAQINVPEVILKRRLKIYYAQHKPTIRQAQKARRLKLESSKTRACSEQIQNRCVALCKTQKDTVRKIASKVNLSPATVHRILRRKNVCLPSSGSWQKRNDDETTQRRCAKLAVVDGLTELEISRKMRFSTKTVRLLLRLQKVPKRRRGPRLGQVPKRCRGPRINMFKFNPQDRLRLDHLYVVHIFYQSKNKPKTNLKMGRTFRTLKLRFGKKIKWKRVKIWALSHADVFQIETETLNRFKKHISPGPVGFDGRFEYFPLDYETEWVNFMQLRVDQVQRIGSQCQTLKAWQVQRLTSHAWRLDMAKRKT